MNIHIVVRDITTGQLERIKEFIDNGDTGQGYNDGSTGDMVEVCHDPDRHEWLIMTARYGEGEPVRYEMDDAGMIRTIIYGDWQ